MAGLLLQGGGDGGGDGDAAAEGPPEPAGSAEVRGAIERAAETRNADDCARLATGGYLRQYERRNRSALAACQKGVFERDRGLLDADVGIRVVKVKGDDALALVTYRDGGYAGITARLALVRDAQGRWVLDRVTGFERASRGQLNRALRSEVASGPVPFGARAGRCAVRALSEKPDAQVEAFLLSAGPDALFGLVAACEPRGFAAALVGELREAGENIHPEREACFERELSRLPPPQLVELLVDVEERGVAALGFNC